jgi:hypothetical protein
MADLRDIETLARLQLEARRSGVRLRAHATDDVRALIAFCGLEDVLSPLLAPRHWTARADEVGARWPR